MTQQFQTQQTSPRTYDPPPLPQHYSIQTSPHNFPQQCSSNTQTTRTVQIQTTTPTTQPIVQTLAYTPAQNTQIQNIQTALTINTLHSDAIPIYKASRNFSRPPLQTIPTNPQSYNLSSTNPNNTQHFTLNNNQLNTLHYFSTSQSSNTTTNMLQNTQIQTSNPPSTTIRTNPYINATYTQPFTNPSNISSNVSSIPTYNTVPPSTIPQSTIPHPT